MTAQGNNNECIYKIDYLNNEPIISNIIDLYQLYKDTTPLTKIGHKPKVTFF